MSGRAALLATSPEQAHAAAHATAMAAMAAGFSPHASLAAAYGLPEGATPYGSHPLLQVTLHCTGSQQLATGERVLSSGGAKHPVTTMVQHPLQMHPNAYAAAAAQQQQQQQAQQSQYGGGAGAYMAAAASPVLPGGGLGEHASPQLSGCVFVVPSKPQWCALWCEMAKQECTTSALQTLNASCSMRLITSCWLASALEFLKCACNRYSRDGGSPLAMGSFGRGGMDLSPARHRPPIARLSSGKLQQLAAHQLRQHYAAAAAQQQQQARLASHYA